MESGEKDLVLLDSPSGGFFFVNAREVDIGFIEKKGMNNSFFRTSLLRNQYGMKPQTKSMEPTTT